MTTEDVLLALLNIGISASDLHLFSIGMLLDMIITYANSHSKSNSKIRQATQEDFNKF